MRTTVTGNLAADPKQIETKDGREFAAFRLVENKRFFDRESQEWKDGRSVGYDVVVEQEQLRANVLASLKSGQRVVVSGNQTDYAYMSKSGEPQVGYRLRATDVAPSLMFNTQQAGPAAGGPDRAAAANWGAPDAGREQQWNAVAPVDVPQNDNAGPGWE